MLKGEDQGEGRGEKQLWAVDLQGVWRARGEKANDFSR